MSKMSELMLDMQELAERGMSAKFIAVSLNVPLQWAQDAIDEFHQHQHLEQQYQMMMDAERSADEDVIYYGERY
jgi:orotate phosphoribosyltransferase-like protein